MSAKSVSAQAQLLFGHCVRRFGLNKDTALRIVKDSIDDTVKAKSSINRFVADSRLHFYMLGDDEYPYVDGRRSALGLIALAATSVMLKKPALGLNDQRPRYACILGSSLCAIPTILHGYAYVRRWWGSGLTLK